MNRVFGVTTLVFLISLIYSSAAVEWFKLPSLCGEGKEFQACGNHCAETCQSARKNGPRLLDVENIEQVQEPMQDQEISESNKVEPKDKKRDDGKNHGLLCKVCVPGCRCRHGLIEDALSSRCVDPTQCPN